MGALADRLLLKAGSKVAIANADAAQQAQLATVEKAASPKEAAAAVLFARTPADLAKHVPPLVRGLREEARLWICFPPEGELSRAALSRALAPHSFESVRTVPLESGWTALMFLRREQS